MGGTPTTEAGGVPAETTKTEEHEATTLQQVPAAAPVEAAPAAAVEADSKTGA